MTDSTTKLLRDLAYEQMMLAKGLDSDLYGQLKAQYSELCADYFDELHNDETTRKPVLIIQNSRRAKMNTQTERTAKDHDLTPVLKLKRQSMAHENRVRQAITGKWYFKFRMNGIKYVGSFETREQAEQALQLQYQVLNLTTTGQKRAPGRKARSARDHQERAKPVRVEKGVYLMYNGKYKADIWVHTERFTKTCETIEQARAFIAEHKKPRKKRVCVKSRQSRQPRQPRQSRQPRQQKTPAEKIAELIQKTQRAKKVNIATGELNKGIALLNNADRPLIKKKKPTIAELSRIAKTQTNPRQYYIEQLRAGAYRV